MAIVSGILGRIDSVERRDAGGLRFWGEAQQQKMGWHEQQQGQSYHQSDEPDGGRNPVLSSVIAQTPNIVLTGVNPGSGLGGGMKKKHTGSTSQARRVHAGNPRR